MASRLSQNAPRSSSSLQRDFSSAALALSYTGGVTAQSAVDYAADPAELITGSLEMNSGKTPRSLPAGFPLRSRHPSTVSAAFSGDPNSSFSSNYILSGDSQSGSQHSRTETRQSIDLSSDPSQASLHFAADLPWNPVAAAEDPSGATSTRTNTSTFRTPNRLNNPYIHFQTSGFHDSALGTNTILSHDETHSLLSSPLTDMDNNYYAGYHLPPQELNYTEELPQPPEEQPQAAPEFGTITSKPRNQRQPRTTEELTCDQCAHVAKTPSDLKKHYARHESPYKCEVQDCPRSVKGFATINDLDRHQKSVHGKNARNSKYYKCFADGCAKSDKKWPRLDNFKQHLVRMHEDDDADVLITRSKEWFESEYGPSGPAQSAAITEVLHSQEQAARGPSQSRKRRRGDSPPSPSARPRKRPLGPPLRTQGMIVPEQDFTRLSPLSAPMNRPQQSMQRSPQSARQPPHIPSWNMYESQSPLTRAQPQGTSRMATGPASSDGRQTTGQMPNAMPQHTAQFNQNFPYTWDSTDIPNFDPNNGTTQSSVGQQQQGQQRRQQNQPQQRPHTIAPDGDFTQVQMAFLHESNPIPPGQDDLDINQFLTNIGTGTALPRSTPASSNEPHTPGQRAPSIAVGNESDSEDDVQQFGDAFQVKLREFLQGFGSKSERRNMLGRGLPQVLEMMSNQGSASASVMSHKSNLGSSSSRSGQSNHMCPTCNKYHARASDLKKHEKRHSRPYGCVLDDCYKRFGSKNDLKRHGDTHPEQKECYRCDGRHRGSDGQWCHKSFYSGRDNYKKHLHQCLSTDPNLIEQKSNDCRIPANNVGRFWCGFCKSIVGHEHIDHVASASFRLSHIDMHFSQGERVSEWIELGGNGLSKAEVERRQNLSRARQIQARNQEKGRTVEETDSPGTSSSSSPPENNETIPQTQPRPQSQGQLWSAQIMQRQTSNISAHSQMSQQQYAQHQHQRQHQQNLRQQPQQQQRPQQQLSQQMQRANSHNVAMQRQAAGVKDPPQRRYNDNGQRMATQAECCQCMLDWPLGFSRECTACGHRVCSDCNTTK